GERNQLGVSKPGARCEPDDSAITMRVSDGNHRHWPGNRRQPGFVICVARKNLHPRPRSIGKDLLQCGRQVSAMGAQPGRLGVGTAVGGGIQSRAGDGAKKDLWSGWLRTAVQQVYSAQIQLAHARFSIAELPPELG